jgi:hypothetical protein
MVPKLLEQPGFLYLLFEEPQRNVDIVVLHVDDDHAIPSDVVGRDGHSSRGCAGLTVTVRPSRALW